jgi:16S rRNA (cytosine1402-N4)-methyltransferase
MRFDPGSSPSAADLVNDLDERALADILFKYGEERHAKRIAKAILQARPINSTRTLADVIAGAVRRSHQRIHPATQSFQALRIAVNKELEAVETVLPEALAALSSGGRLAVIAFHSLEDRLVKRFFRRESRDCICPAQQPVCTCGHTASMRELTRKPVRPKPAEMEVNARARSARLRVAEKK